MTNVRDFSTGQPRASKETSQHLIAGQLALEQLIARGVREDEILRAAAYFMVYLFDIGRMKASDFRAVPPTDDEAKEIFTGARWLFQMADSFEEEANRRSLR